MHRALLLDEILRQIFVLCLHNPSDEFPSLTISRLARCCRAWKDPALDRLWRRLSCILPLLELISSLSLVNEAVNDQDQFNEVARLLSYGRRVRQITCRCTLRFDTPLRSNLKLLSGSNFIAITSSPSIAHILPNLTHLQLAIPSLPNITSILLSNRLRSVNLDLGFRSPSSSLATTQSQVACAYLTEVHRVSGYTLECLTLRGALSTQLSRTVAGMTSLRSISLHTGLTLDRSLFLAMSHFPALEKLDIHAGQVDEKVVREIPPSTPFFPALQDFRIRADPAVVEGLLERLTSGVLRTFHAETQMTGSSVTFASWRPVLVVLATMNSKSIQEITIEHHIDPEAATQITDLPNFDTSNLPVPPTSKAIIDILRPLAMVGNLHHFAINSNIISDLTDRNLEEIASWWPRIKHLELGMSPGSGPTCCCFPRATGESSPSSQRSLYPSSAIDPNAPETLPSGLGTDLTLSCLGVLARRCPDLRSLTLPLRGSHVPHPAPSRQDTQIRTSTNANPLCTRLERLSLGPLGTVDRLQVAAYLHALFPSLQEVWGQCGCEEDCVEGDREQINASESRTCGWEDVGHALARLHRTRQVELRRGHDHLDWIFVNLADVDSIDMSVRFANYNSIHIERQSFICTTPATKHIVCGRCPPQYTTVHLK